MLFCVVNYWEVVMFEVSRGKNRKDHPEEDEAAVSEREKHVVVAEVERMREFVDGISGADLKNGTWFAKLLTYSLGNYTQKVDAAYFREKYPDLPRDAIVDARIRMAARYASIEGGLSAGAYTGAVAGTIGSLGGASPITVTAGVASFVVDMSYTTQIQLRTAYDLAVLYGTPIDMDDPDDVFKLVRIALAIKAGEAGGVAIGNAAPAVIRRLLKKYYSRSVLASAKSLPVIGKYLLQRNVIKFAIPAVGVPLSATVNFWTTNTAGKHAKAVFRNEAKIMEAARRSANAVTNQGGLLWAMWLVMRADGDLRENEMLLYHHVSALVRRSGGFESDLEEIQNSITVDEDRAWQVIKSLGETGTDIYPGAVLAAAVGGTVVEEKMEILEEIALVVGAEFSAKDVHHRTKKWAKE